MDKPAHLDDLTEPHRGSTRGLDVVHRQSGWIIALGILLIVVGILAIAASFTATLATVIVFGVLLLIGGAAQLIHAFSARGWNGFFLHLAIGVLDLVAASLMLSQPAASALALTLLLAAFFFGVGLMRIIVSATERFPSWGWSLFNGAINVLLGILIWAQWPFSGLWVIGLFVGIDLLFSGVSLIMLASATRRVMGRYYGAFGH